MDCGSSEVNQKSAAGIGTLPFHPSGETWLPFTNWEFDTLKGSAQHQPIGTQHKRLFFGQLLSNGIGTEEFRKTAPAQIDVERKPFAKVRNLIRQSQIDGGCLIGAFLASGRKPGPGLGINHQSPFVKGLMDSDVRKDHQSPLTSDSATSTMSRWEFGNTANNLP